MKILRVLIPTVLLCFLILSVLPVHGEQAVYENVIRLHVIANSDSPVDQRLKLSVRDAVLALCAPQLCSCTDRAQAEAVVASLSDEIQATAEKALRAEGCHDAVTVELGKEPYPEKRYERLCFPSGEYLSLRIRIGEAEGQNWWCVLFPPLCLSAATAKEAEEAFVAVGFTPEQYRIITRTDQVTYKLRFKFLELFQRSSEN